MPPSTSVVIPTLDRPELVVRAVGSALAQTMHDLEVIVVAYSGDPAIGGLKQIDDTRLRLHLVPQPLKLGAARNAGVDVARGTWVAFLDDDDEWLPKKVELQLERAERSTSRFPIVFCRFIARRPGADFIWPRRFPEPDEPISEYLYCRRSVFWGEGTVLPSTILTRRELLQRCPYNATMPRHEDNDWLLRACMIEGVGVEPASSEPLAVWHIDDRPDRIGNKPDWRHNFNWIKSNPHLVTPRAYASFLLTGTSLATARAGHWEAFVPLLREACLGGRPRPFDLALYLAVWMMPNAWQRLLAESNSRRQR